MSRAAHDTARAMLDAGLTPAEVAETMVKKPFQFQRREVSDALALITSAAAPTDLQITDEAPEVVASAMKAAGYTRLPAGRTDRLDTGDVVIVHMRPGSLAVSRWRRGG